MTDFGDGGGFLAPIRWKDPPWIGFKEIKKRYWDQQLNNVIQRQRKLYQITDQMSNVPPNPVFHALVMEEGGWNKAFLCLIFVSFLDERLVFFKWYEDIVY